MPVQNRVLSKYPDRELVPPYACSRLSVRLRALADGGAETLTLDDLTRSAGEGGMALSLAVLAIVCSVPGLGPALGLSICALSIALITGSDRLPLPGFLRRRSLRRDRMANLIARSLQPLQWVEARLKPRLSWLTRDAWLPTIGLACFLDGLLIILPVPFGNLPPAMALLPFAVGMAARDGLLILSGFVASLLAVALDAALIVLFWDVVQAAIDYAR